MPKDKEIQANGKKSKNFFSLSMLKPIIVLTVICILVSTLLAFTNAITSPIIKQNEIEMALKSRKEMLPNATEFSEIVVDVPNVVSVNKDDGGSGYVIVATGKGYKGGLFVTVALDTMGTIIGIKADSSSETPGVGSKVALSPYIDQYLGLRPGETDSIAGATQGAEEDGGDTTQQPQIDILSGATITSKALNSAVNSAFDAYLQVKEG